jgi:formate dehydrogenase maturation protein FdhE
LYKIYKVYNVPRGGKREKSGRKSNWNHSKTQLIRVPAVFVEQIMALARELDSESNLDFVQNLKEESTTIQLDLLDSVVSTPALISSLEGVSTPEKIIEKRYVPMGQNSNTLCPQCQSSSLKKDGKTKEGKQRYECKVCKKRFVERAEV